MLETESALYLQNTHLYNATATLSHAAVSSDIPDVNIGTERLINALATAFFIDGSEQHLEDFYAFEYPELLGYEWQRE